MSVDVSDDVSDDAGDDTGDEPRVQRFGDDAVLVELADLVAVGELDAAVRALHDPRIVDQVPAARTLLLRGPDPAVLTGLVATAWATRPDRAAADPGGLVTLEVVYDGEDLADVAG